FAKQTPNIGPNTLQTGSDVGPKLPPAPVVPVVPPGGTVQFPAPLKAPHSVFVPPRPALPAVIGGDRLPEHAASNAATASARWWRRRFTAASARRRGGR